MTPCAATIAGRITGGGRSTRSIRPSSPGWVVPTPNLDRLAAARHRVRARLRGQHAVHAGAARRVHRPLRVSGARLGAAGGGRHSTCRACCRPPHTTPITSYGPGRTWSATSSPITRNMWVRGLRQLPLRVQRLRVHPRPAGGIRGPPPQRPVLLPAARPALQAGTLLAQQAPLRRPRAGHAGGAHLQHRRRVAAPATPATAASTCRSTNSTRTNRGIRRKRSCASSIRAATIPATGPATRRTPEWGDHYGRG